MYYPHVQCTNFAPILYAAGCKRPNKTMPSAYLNLPNHLVINSYTSRVKYKQEHIPKEHLNLLRKTRLLFQYHSTESDCGQQKENFYPQKQVYIKMTVTRCHRVQSWSEWPCIVIISFCRATAVHMKRLSCIVKHTDTQTFLLSFPKMIN